MNGYIGFHCKGTRYPKRDADGCTPFEALVSQHRPADPALRRMAAIVRDADGPAGKEQHPEAVGLRVMTVAFPEVAKDDEEIAERSAFLYDSLYFTLSRATKS